MAFWPEIFGNGKTRLTGAKRHL